ncbi:MAG: O-antigen ligase family protein [Xanthobacteraceae bacterium]
MIMRGAAKKFLDVAGDWGLIVGVSVFLPWSTTITAYTIAIWVLNRIGAVDVAALRRELTKPAGGLPVLLWALAAVGMLWADVPWEERLAGLGGFNKLLFIPLLLARFGQSPRGMIFLYGFFASTTILLLVSWTLKLFPNLPWQGRGNGIPVKDYIIQATEFLLCAFVLLEAAIEDIRTGRQAIGFWLLLLASIFLANIFFVATGRTELVVIPALLVIICWRHLGWKGIIGGGTLVGIVAAGLWFSSPYFHDRIMRTANDLQNLNLDLTSNSLTETAAHVEFLRESLIIVEKAPIFGHGTGSIGEQFRNAVGNKTAVSDLTFVNPHNQIFGVAIQNGLVGAAILVAMWVAHLMLFRGSGLIAWIGLVIVLQNIISSVFNSHLFDFAEGWLYVFGVGVVGGMINQQKSSAQPSPVKD